MKTFGVYVGRFNPIHRGHGAVIVEMLRICGHNALLIIGSANASFSLRNFFEYCERRDFILSLYPDLKVAGLPDFPLSDSAWLVALDDLIRLTGNDPLSAVYFGGCAEDVRLFAAAGRFCHIVDRFSGKTGDISATKVRDALIHHHDEELQKLLIPGSKARIVGCFERKWEEFKKI